MDTALLVGRVADSSGTVIVEARVELVDVDRNTKDKVQTNKSGLYVFPAIRPSHYRIEVSAPGYKSASAAVTIFVQDDIQQNFRLATGSPLESIIIETNGTPVGTTGAVGTVVEQTLVRELPLNGRSFQTLFQLTPGVVITPTSFASQGQFSVNGQRTNTNYFIIDGVSANVAIAAGVNPGQSAGGSLPAVTAFGGTNSLVSADDVQEFAVLTSSYAPEFGRMPGAQVSIVTRSGTNEFHGEVFDYVRNDAFDANDWFANRDNLKRAALRQNDYGGVFGGPILKDRTFFFTSYEGSRLRQPTSIESEVPSVAARNDAPISIKPFLNAYPLPNGPDEGNGLARATYAFSNPSSLDTVSVRIDHHIGASLFVFGRYDYSTSDRKQRGAGINSLSTVTNSHFVLQTFTGGLTYRGSTFINDLRFNVSESSASGRDQLDGFSGAVPFRSELVFPPPFKEENSLFQFLPAVNARIRQLTLGREAANVQTQINVVNNVSYQIRNHLLKAGVDFRSLSPETAPAVYAQQAAFVDIQAALSLRSAFIAVAATVTVHSTFRNYSAYSQDAWKVAKRLSVAYGLRWDYNGAPSGRGANGQQPFAIEHVNNLPALSLAPLGTRIYHSTLNNFAPRLGLAYELRRSSRTESIIKAGAGMFYDLGNGPAGNAFDGTNFPFLAQKLFFGLPFPLSREDASPPPSIPPIAPFRTVVAFPSVLKVPYTWQWNLALQQSLGAEQTLNVGYVGSSGHSLLRTEEYVGGVAGVPNMFTQVLFTNNAGCSNYNALQVRFQRRSSSDARFIASYSFSHSFDNVSTDSIFNGIPGQFLNPRVDYGSSDFDIRHTATLGVDYSPKFAGSSHALNTLLGNWGIDSIAMIRSSPPVNVTVSRDIGFGVYDFRPDLLPGIAMYVDDPSVPGGRRFNPTALSVPSAQQQGSLRRNVFRGFALFQVDLAVQRNFRITERISIKARLEAFNLFNHPSFSPESGEMGTLDSSGTLVPQIAFGLSQATLAHGLAGGRLGAFGSGFSPLYQVGGARSLQVAVKLGF
jgi:hypothetical protein